MGEKGGGRDVSLRGYASTTISVPLNALSPFCFFFFLAGERNLYVISFRYAFSSAKGYRHEFSGGGVSSGLFSGLESFTQSSSE